MTNILAIETATKNCSVALFQNGELKTFKELAGSYSHAENLAVFAEEVLTQAAISFDELQAIAISKGPGSYTGLRIGVSFAKGLCYGIGVPLISLDTLQHMVSSAVEFTQNPDALYCSMIDARRMEVYAAIYDAQLQESRKIKAEVVDESTYLKFLDQKKVYFYGDGALKCEKVITHSNAVFLDLLLPSAKSMGSLAQKAFEKHAFVDLAYFEPFYYKEFVALKGKSLV
jgi:tRNA threonylcarbamoyladenosine biosynthesis protein TsaB